MLSDLYTTIKTAVTASGGRLLVADEETLDRLKASNRKLDGEWFFSVDGQDPDIINVNDEEHALLCTLVGLWSASDDLKQMERAVTAARSVVRATETSNLPEAVMRLSVEGRMDWTVQYGIIAVEIPILAVVRIE